MGDDKTGRRRVDEGYEPLQKGFTPTVKKGYTPNVPAQPAPKPPQGGSGGMPKPPVADKK